MKREIYNLSIAADSEFNYGGIVTVDYMNESQVRFVIERPTAGPSANAKWYVDSDEIVPVDMLPIFLKNCKLAKTEQIA